MDIKEDLMIQLDNNFKTNIIDAKQNSQCSQTIQLLDPSGYSLQCVHSPFQYS